MGSSRAVMLIALAALATASGCGDSPQATQTLSPEGEAIVAYIETVDSLFAQWYDRQAANPPRFDFWNAPEGQELAWQVRYLRYEIKSLRWLLERVEAIEAPAGVGHGRLEKWARTALLTYMTEEEHAGEYAYDERNLGIPYDPIEAAGRIQDSVNDACEYSLRPMYTRWCLGLLRAAEAEGILKPGLDRSDLSPVEERLENLAGDVLFNAYYENEPYHDYYENLERDD